MQTLLIFYNITLTAIIFNCFLCVGLGVGVGVGVLGYNISALLANGGNCHTT